MLIPTPHTKNNTGDCKTANEGITSYAYPVSSRFSFQALFRHCPAICLLRPYDGGTADYRSPATLRNFYNPRPFLARTREANVNAGQHLEWGS